MKKKASCLPLLHSVIVLFNSLNTPLPPKKKKINSVQLLPVQILQIWKYVKTVACVFLFYF